MNVNCYALVGRYSLRVSMSANSVLRWIFCPRRVEMTGGYRELHSKELCEACRARWRMSWAHHVVRMVKIWIYIYILVLVW